MELFPPNNHQNQGQKFLILPLTKSRSPLSVKHNWKFSLTGVMISNERPSPFGRRPYNQPRPQVQEDTLKNDKVQIERKTFLFSLKENPRGRFLRITEDVNGRRDNIIIPATGLDEFKKVFDEMVKAAQDKPVEPS
jgi:hypothetical protein